jgi:hypothetical protein
MNRIPSRALPLSPYRFNPADLPVPGWLEGEFGGLHTSGEDQSRADSVPWLLKYAFDENHGLLLGGNAYVSAQPAGASKQSSFGDTFLEWKQRFPVSDNAAFGIEAGVVAPTASHDLGIGKAQWEANGIFSSDFGAMHLDLNLGEARGGEQPMNVSPWQTTWAAAVSASLTDSWGTAFEFSGTHQRGLRRKAGAGRVPVRFHIDSCSCWRRLWPDAQATAASPLAHGADRTTALNQERA